MYIYLTFFYLPIIVSSPSLSFFPKKIIIIIRHHENLRITLCSLFYYYYICMCTLLRTTEFFGGSRGRLIFRSLVSGTRLGYNIAEKQPHFRQKIYVVLFGTSLQKSEEWYMYYILPSQITIYVYYCLSLIPYHPHFHFFKQPPRVGLRPTRGHGWPSASHDHGWLGLFQQN